MRYDAPLNPQRRVARHDAQGHDRIPGVRPPYRDSDAFPLVGEVLGDAGDNSGNLAIRGSVYREMGNLPAAVADYQRVVDLRRDNGGAAIGEAETELGYALLLSGARARGIDLMAEGLRLLREQPADGFQIRAMRKLAAGYARTGKWVGRWISPSRRTTQR